MLKWPADSLDLKQQVCANFGLSISVALYPGPPFNFARGGPGSLSCEPAYLTSSTYDCNLLLKMSVATKTLPAQCRSTFSTPDVTTIFHDHTNYCSKHVSAY